MAGPDQKGAGWADKSALDRAADFHQLSGNQNVDVADAWGERKYGPLFALRCHLNIIDGRAGALGYACHGGGLGDPAIAFGQFNDPIGENAAALAAHCEYGEFDDLILSHHLLRKTQGLAIPACL